MGLWKEELYELAEISKLQYQVYDDACDRGITIESFEHPQLIKMKAVIDRLPDSMKERTESRTRTSVSVCITWTLTFEWDDDNVQIIHCVYYRRGKHQMIQIYQKTVDKSVLLCYNALLSIRI